MEIDIKPIVVRKPTPEQLERLQLAVETLAALIAKRERKDDENEN
jgi:hypothetical protein